MSQEKATTVVIAEDDFLVCEDIERIVKKIGYQTIGKASSGDKAVDLVCSLKPDVALLDIEMPKMNGLEASLQIQQKEPTPVVIITAHDSQSFIEDAGRKGVGAFISKPPDQKKLEQAIVIAIARHNDLKELRKVNSELEEALAEIKTLKGIIPICAKCKKIRDDQDCWNNLETYLEEHSDAQFSHGICEDCAEELYGDQKWYKKVKEKKSQPT